MDINTAYHDLMHQNEHLITRLRRVTLENLIHDENDFPVTIPVLGEYLFFHFRSDYLLLAVIHKRPGKTTPPTSASNIADRPVIQYDAEAVAFIDTLLSKYFQRKTQFISFRADKDIGVLLNPSADFFSKGILSSGQYYREVIQSLEKFVSDLNQELESSNIITLSPLYQNHVSVRQMYLDAKTTFDYSWNRPESVLTYTELHVSPLSPEAQKQQNALEQEFMGNINHLMVFEASIVLDQILENQFARHEPLDDIIWAVVARLRNVEAAMEFLTSPSQTVSDGLSGMISEVAQSTSVPELQDRIHDFFALISEFAQREPMKKSQQVLDFIESNYNNHALSAQMLCDRFRISRSYLSRILQAETGCGLVERIHDIRVQHAKQLLTETSMKIDQIAIQVGFSNRFGLLRAFKGIEGCSPSEYRDRNLQTPSSHS